MAYTALILFPLQYVTVALIPDTLMLFGGTDEPCAHVDVLDVGPLEVDNKTFSASVFKLLQEKLGIPDNRLVTVSLSIVHSCILTVNCLSYPTLIPF